jgi:hypothetical protein
MAKKIILYVGIVVVAVVAFFILLQLVPYGRNHTNPPVVKEPAWDSPQTRALAVRACFDCHSNQTAWPWYTNVAPASWLVQHDVDEGRSRLNFSECGVPRPRGGEGGEGGEGGGDAARTVLRGRMPPAQYTIIHTNAILTDAERQALAQGLQNSPCK